MSTHPLRHHPHPPVFPHVRPYTFLLLATDCSHRCLSAQRASFNSKAPTPRPARQGQWGVPEARDTSDPIRLISPLAPRARAHQDTSGASRAYCPVDVLRAAALVRGSGIGRRYGRCGRMRDTRSDGENVGGGVLLLLREDEGAVAWRSRAPRMYTMPTPSRVFSGVPGFEDIGPVGPGPGRGACDRGGGGGTHPVISDHSRSDGRAGGHGSSGGECSECARDVVSEQVVPGPRSCLVADFNRA